MSKEKAEAVVNRAGLMLVENVTTSPKGFLIRIRYMGFIVFDICGRIACTLVFISDVSGGINLKNN